MPRRRSSSSSRGTVSRRVAPFAPLALALLMQNAVLPSTHGTPATAHDNLDVAVCGDVSSFSDCHSQYPTGCTHSGAYDTYLNLLKNQISFPASSAPIDFFTADDQLSTLDRQAQELPEKPGSRNHANLKDQLAAMGEGQLHGALGFLYSVTPENKGTGETSNCKLHDKESDVDFHIGIGFDENLAARIREAASGGKKLTTDEKAEIRHTTFIVEMTPHYRAKFHSGWTSDSLKKVMGRRVKVVGQLMADSEHNVTSQNCGLGITPDCWRATIWELHPVTQFQVCHSTNTCEISSSDWKDLEQESPSDTGNEPE
jgi:hypothetical protein